MIYVMVMATWALLFISQILALEDAVTEDPPVPLIAPEKIPSWYKMPELGQCKSLGGKDLPPTTFTTIPPECNSWDSQ